MDKSPLLDSTAFKLNRAAVLIERIADDYLRQSHGIRYAPFLVLMMARLIGPTSQQAIAANLNVSRASVTQRAAALVADGHLVVTIDPRDGRANLVTLTPSGTELFDRAWAGLESRQDGLDTGVDERALATALDRLIANAVAALGEGS